MNQALHKPAKNEVEVSIFGPGFGESILIHAGNDEWIVVDSCFDSRTGEAAALSYLNEIQVDPATAVKLIVATHWHDDHIAGMASLVDACVSAAFACSMALTRSEFLEVAKVYSGRPVSGISLGPTEIYQTLSILKGRQQVPRYATADRPLFTMKRPPTDVVEWEVTSLSPVDGELQRFLASLAALIPTDSPATTKSRLPNPRRNDISVATWIKIGDIQILLGADLEEHGVPHRGWTAVLSSSSRPPGAASLFKIPHHGSANGHHDEVWTNMLVDSPMAGLTPWTLGGSNLPLTGDIQRIKSFTSNAYSTSKLTPSALNSLPQIARRTFREGGIRIRSVEPPTGFLRFRTDVLSKGATVWTVTSSPDALRL